MHRTLYTATMIDTFRACKHAYNLAFLQNDLEAESLGFICKKFMLRALAQINKGRITSISQLQKYMGQHWPAEQFGSNFEHEAITKAFLYIYKTLLRYLAKPYKPQGSKIVGVALNIRARVPHARVYSEDTFDLILWYPEEQKLELVDFTVQPLRAIDPAWPSTTVLFKKYLAEKLQTRWPYKKLSINFQQLGLQDFSPLTIEIEESIYRSHWSEVIKTLEQMKALEMAEFEGKELKYSKWQPHDKCKHCEMLLARSRYSQNIKNDMFCQTA